MENSNTFLETIEQRTFETVSSSASHNGQDNSTEFQNSTEMEGSSCKNFADHPHHKNGHTVHEVHESFKRKDDNHSRRVIEEEDETEELFQPSDDRFFKVISQPVVQEFNSLLSESLNDSHALSANFGNDITTNGTIPTSDILNDNHFRSFKLLKAQGSSQARADKQVLENNSGQLGGDQHQSTITDQEDRGFSQPTDPGLYSNQEKP